MADKQALHYRYNMGYLIGVLIVAIVVLVTVKWGAIEELAQYITFGLTLTSLALALIAIFYAIISNVAQSRSLASLQAAGDSLNGVAANLGRMSNNLESSFSELPALIRGVEEKVELTRQEIAHGSLREEMESPPAAESGVGEKLDDGESRARRFALRSSFAGQLMIYAAQLAFKTKKPFELGKLFGEKGIGREYGQAYLVAAASAGFLSFVSKDDLVNVTEVDPGLPEMRKVLVYWIKWRKDKNPDDWDVDEMTSTWIDPIDRYFQD